MVIRGAARPKGWREDRYRQLIEKLIAERKRLGLAQEELAVRLNRQQHYVSRYETGARRLDVAEFAEAALGLGLDPAALVSEVWPGDKR
jgi:transcriptional regulator with XRE-family HTH domain